MSSYLHFRSNGKVSGWSLSAGSMISGIIFLILSPLFLSTIFPTWVLVMGALALLVLGVVVQMRFNAKRPARDYADAVAATRRAADWIRVHHGREPRDDNEVYLVAKTKFW